MKPIRITAISYYNTLPFIYGLTNSGLLSGYKLNLEVPSVSARKIISNEAEIGLIPVGALPGIPDYHLVSNLCIGADKDVKSVLLLSNSELQNIKTIYLDTDSLTSVNLVRVLARKYWNINPNWRSLSELQGELSKEDGMVLIGDKTFGLSGQYLFSYDLAAEWIKFTGLPFVFAVWISRNPLPKAFKKSFQAALEWGVEHKVDSVIMAVKPHITEQELISYLKNDISYSLDEQKMKGMELFLNFCLDFKGPNPKNQVQNSKYQIPGIKFQIYFFISVDTKLLIPGAFAVSFWVLQFGIWILGLIKVRVHEQPKHKEEIRS